MKKNPDDRRTKDIRRVCAYWRQLHKRITYSPKAVAHGFLGAFVIRNRQPATQPNLVNKRSFLLSRLTHNAILCSASYFKSIHYVVVLPLLIPRSHSSLTKQFFCPQLLILERPKKTPDSRVVWFALSATADYASLYFSKQSCCVFLFFPVLYLAIGLTGLF